MMRFISRTLIVILLVTVAIFSVFNLSKVNIQLPGFEPISLSLAAAALIFFSLGFLCCTLSLGFGFLKLYWELRKSKKKIRELESQLPQTTKQMPQETH